MFELDGFSLFRECRLSIFPLFTAALCSCSATDDRPPNFVVIFTDDQGYNDLGCFGANHVTTPNIDQLAAEGIKLTSFYVAAPLSSPSRAALMTGCYPKRIGLASGSKYMVLLSDDEWGLNPSELTIAEILKDRGYATGIFGKWHLGDQPVFLPTRHGFDEFFGLPYSHDIHPYHPRQEHLQFPPLPLYEGENIIEHDPDADYLTRRITEKAVSFIDRHGKEPFFLYIPHPLPHAPLHVSPGFMESVPDSIRKILLEENSTIDYQTRRQLFPQAISEIDWSVGEIMKALKRNRLDDHTMVIFTTDNGPAIGSAKPLRGRKGSTYEGGMRVPAIVRWQGKITEGEVSDELLTTMDLLPTFAFLAEAEVPDDRSIDGRNIWPVLAGVEGTKSPHDMFFYHRGNDLIAVRCGQWKLHRLRENEFELYNLEDDIAETIDMAEKRPDLVMKLSTIMDEFNREMGDSLKTRPQGKAILIE